MQKGIGMVYKFYFYVYAAMQKAPAEEVICMKELTLSQLKYTSIKKREV